MRFNKPATLVGSTLLLFAAAFFASPADAQVLTGGNVAGATNCILGGAANGPVNAVATLFQFGNGSNLIGAAAAYYERLVFSVVVGMIIIRIVVRASAEGIDSFIINAFNSTLGPSILFAFGLFIATSIGNGGNNFVLNTIVHNAETFGVTLGAGYQQQGYGAIAPAIDLTGAMDQGNVGGVVRSGICIAETVAFGVPAGNTAGDRAILFFMGLTATVNAMMKGPAGIITQAILTVLQALAALYVLWVFTRLIFEVFVLYLKKIFLIPIGLILFAFGQLDIFAFFKDGYIRMVSSILVQALMLALLLPLFVGILIGTAIIATQDMAAAAAGSGNTIGRFVDVFVIVLGTAFLDFFLKNYVGFADAMMHGSGGPSGGELQRSVQTGIASTGGVIAGAVQKGVTTALALGGSLAAQSAMNAMRGAGAAAGTISEAASAATSADVMAAESAEASEAPQAIDASRNLGGSEPEEVLSVP
jgi:hypothetical protein